MFSRIKKNPGYALVIFGIFVGMMLFYTTAHPLYPWTRDDWWQINFMRLPVPTYLEYNPTKILPETILPFTAYLSVWIVYPLTHDYLGALSIGSAFTLSLLVVLYVLAFGRLIKKTLSVNNGLLMFMSVSFVLFHFMVFGRSGDGVSTLCLWGSDYLNNIYNYIVPALANLALSMYIMTDRDRKMMGSMGVTGRSLFILAIYLCINSNIFQSVILMSALFAQSVAYIMFDLRKSGDNSGRDRASDGNVLVRIIKARRFDLAVLAVFLAAAFMEATGGRAGSFSGSSMSETLSWFAAAIRDQWPLFPLSAAFFAAAALVMYMVRKRGGNNCAEDREFARTLVELIIMCIVTGICDILVSSRVRADYIYGHKVMIGVISCTAIIGMYSVTYLFKNGRALQYIMPLMLYLLVYMTVFDDRVYVDYNGKASETKVRVFDEYMIDSYVEADRKGMDSFTLLLPEENPIDKAGGNGGNSIANTLYRHGIIKSKPVVTVETGTVDALK